MLNDRFESGRRHTSQRGSSTAERSIAAPDTYDSQPTEGPTWTSFTKRPLQRKEANGAGKGLPKEKPAFLSPEASAAALGESDPNKPQAPNQTGLPDRMKSNLEAMSGFDMSDVRVHRNSAKPAQVGALAYTQGSQIHLGPGQEKHLGHEAWHVAQQKQGRVKANTQFKGVLGNDDDALEQEADAVGAQLDESDSGSDDDASHDVDDDQSQ